MLLRVLPFLAPTLIQLNGDLLKLLPPVTEGTLGRLPEIYCHYYLGT